MCIDRLKQKYFLLGKWGEPQHILLVVGVRAARGARCCARFFVVGPEETHSHIEALTTKQTTTNGTASLCPWLSKIKATAVSPYPSPRTPRITHATIKILRYTFFWRKWLL